MLRRLAVTSAASLAALGAAAPAAGAAAGPLPVPIPLLSRSDTLTITVERSGNPAADGTFRLECGPERATGTHPRAQRACARLEELSKGGRDPFAPLPEDRVCTQQYGGPATARVEGTWHGRPVDARFSRADGCEIARWENLRPVLPMTRS
ncbi:SSI family serine proteinase inhibitor [Streptomyces sp. CC228A]|uniref:SSI family serine proteinase inhibitor n=1 Tax=Streptomyces sp. CC228A TaxID=2898186 RepID=UPI001F2A5350|nr:SSI family serine proteinase inhibitor [Streptomyces sp. CC228A]